MNALKPPNTHSFITALSPIEYRDNDPEGRLRSIRKALVDHEQGNSPFSDCPMAHMVRLQIIDQLTPTMGDISGRRLKTKYLLFVADVDGVADDLLDCLYGADAEFVSSVWGRCLGYPDYQGAVFFRRYIRRCQIERPLAFAAFPNSVTDTLRMLTRKQKLAQWVATNQGKPAAELQQQWRQDREQFTHPKLPKPGTL